MRTRVVYGVAATVVLVAVIALVVWPGSESDEDPGQQTGTITARGGDSQDLSSHSEEGDSTQRGIGTVQPLPPDLNENVKSVVEAARTGEHPERLSVFIQPKPFDADAWERDPQAYLDVVEPGRAYQSAQPGPGIPVLRPIGRRFHTLLQGESTALKVLTKPGAPVTFTSFDLGAFVNKLTTITVKADTQGIATAEFFATPGTINNVNILAGSPMATGQVEFMVYIQLPETPATASAESPSAVDER